MDNAIQELRKEFCLKMDFESVMSYRQEYAGDIPKEDGFCDDYVYFLEQRVISLQEKQSKKETPNGE